MGQPGRLGRRARHRTRTQMAAGALVWRERAGRLEVLLVHRPRYDDWSWPKGKLEPGEHPVVAACREVAEETGRPVVIGQPLPSLRYRISGRRRKYVYYWAARVVDDADAPGLVARPPVTPADRREIDQVRWVEAGRARRRLTRRSNRRPLDALVARWRAGTLEARAVIVLRHAAAVGRAAWTGSEAKRPLTEPGRKTAVQLVGLLAAYGVEAVWTSPWKRCRQTVKPYARAVHLARIGVEALTETAAAADPAGAARAMRQAMASEVPLVVCTHRPVLGVLFGVLAATAPERRSRRSIPRSDPYLRPGEMLVAHVADRLDRAFQARVVVAIERHRPGRPDPAVLFHQA